MNEQQEAEFADIIITSFTAFWEEVLGFLPNIIAALLVLVFGIVLAKVAKAFISRLLGFLRFDQLVEKSGLESFLIGSDYNIRLSSVVSGTFYWLIILMTITAVAELFELEAIKDLLERIVNYLPNILLALAILIVGTIFSRIVNRYVFTHLKEIAMDFALKAAIAAEVIVQVFVWFLALEQLQVNTVLLLVMLSCIMGALALAAAIAFGLAGQTIALDMLQRWRSNIASSMKEDK